MRIYYYSGSSEHPYFREEYGQLKQIADCIPSNPSYEKKREGSTRFREAKQYGKIVSWLRQKALKVLLWLGIPKVRSVKTDADLVYSCGYLIANKPYVVTFEDSSVFFYHRFLRWNRKLTQWLIGRQLASDKCKRIIPWTQAAKKSLASLYGEDRRIMDKVEVVYPAIGPGKRKVHEGKGKHILFIGQSFMLKGGWETVKACRQLTCDYHLHIVSKQIPVEFGEDIEKDRNITVYENITEEEKERLFSMADIYVMPTHYDTLGFTFMEAMARGIPCIVAEHFASGELVEHGKDGFVVDNTVSIFDKNNLHYDETYQSVMERLHNPDKKYIKDLSSAIEKLLTDGALREAFSKAAYEKVRNGRFSVEEKQKHLKRILETLKV